MRSLISFSCIAASAFLCCCVGVRAQETPAATPPKDPKALMFAARKLNNLAAADAKPWHIKATFQLFGDDGTVTEEGTYEEFWASPSQFKRTFTGKQFAQTAYGSNKGVLLANTQGETPDLLLAARNNLVSPMPYFDATIQHTTYTTKQLDSGSVKLLCAVPTGSTPGAPPDTSAYCFNTDEPMLRIATRPSTSDQTFHNRLTRVEDRVIATELKITHNGKPTVALHVQDAAVLDGSQEAVFTPPPDAVPAPLRINVADSVTAGMLQYKVAPEYPIAAHRAHISGVVVLQAVIGKNGHIKDVKPISGPEALQGAAMQAVWQWQYRPYLLNGEPVEVTTTINVTFAL
jgi:TonB family protein